MASAAPLAGLFLNLFALVKPDAFCTCLEQVHCSNVYGWWNRAISSERGPLAGLFLDLFAKMSETIVWPVHFPGFHPGVRGDVHAAGPLTVLYKYHQQFVRAQPFKTH